MQPLDSQWTQQVSVEWLSLTSIKDSLTTFTRFLHQPRRYDQAIDEIIPSYKLARVIRKKKPVYFTEKRITVPAGLITTYRRYGEALHPGIEVARALQTQVLTPFYRYCGELLERTNTGEDARRLSALDDFHPNDIDTPIERIGACFDATSYTTTVAFKQAFAQVRQVESDADTFSTLIDGYRRTDGRSILKQLDQLSELLTTLEDRLTENDTASLFNDVEQQRFAQLCYTVGRDVEFYGHLGYRLQQLSVAFNTCAKQLGA
jgi:hypothetical protein